MKKTAILIDGAWFSNALKASVRLPNSGVTADIIHKNALAMLGKDEDLFRIFYYDSLPFDSRAANPIMIPAMKLARREGVQVAIVQVGSRRLSPELIEDSDLIRQFAIVV